MENTKNYTTQNDSARIEIHHVDGQGYCWELMVMDGVVIDSCVGYFSTVAEAEIDAAAQDITALIQ